MKKIILLLLVLSANVSFSQSDADIANVYIKRATESAEGLRYEESIEYFEKALKYKDTITKPSVAYLGMLIYFETKNFEAAHDYAKQYFVVAKNKKTEEYLETLDTYVTITERLEEIAELKRQEEVERLRKEKELARIDSLQTVWKQNSGRLSIKADSIYSFNKNSLAIYQKDNSFGIIDDLGNIIIEADEFKNADAFDGYIVLTNKKENPTKVFSFNTSTKKGFTLPKASEFNTTSTNYGQVMSPRANGSLVMYPNNSLKTMVYDVNEKNFVEVLELKELLKSLRKTDKIEKSNSDNQVRLDKEYYNFGGHIGGGIHPLYTDDFSLYGYLFSVNGKVLSASEYGYLGAFEGEKVQAINGKKIVWLNQQGDEITAPKSKFSEYEGLSKVSRIENGNYQINQDGIIVLGEEKLIQMEEFIKKNSPK